MEGDDHRRWDMVGEGDLLRDEREKTPVGKLRLWNWEGLGRGPPDLGRKGRGRGFSGGPSTEDARERFRDFHGDAERREKS